MDELSKLLKDLPKKPLDPIEQKIKYADIVKKINNMLLEAVEIKDRRTTLDSSLNFMESLLVVTEGLKTYIWEQSGLIEAKEKQGHWLITIAKIILRILGFKI